MPILDITNAEAAADLIKFTKIQDKLAQVIRIQLQLTEEKAELTKKIGAYYWDKILYDNKTFSKLLNQYEQILDKQTKVYSIISNRSFGTWNNPIDDALKFLIKWDNKANGIWDRILGKNIILPDQIKNSLKVLVDIFMRLNKWISSRIELTRKEDGLIKEIIDINFNLKNPPKIYKLGQKVIQPSELMDPIRELNRLVGLQKSENDLFIKEIKERLPELEANLSKYKKEISKSDGMVDLTGLIKTSIDSLKATV